MMEYVVIGLVLCIIAILIYKNPHKVKSVLFNLTFRELKKQEPFIVQAVYNFLPSKYRNVVSSQVIAEVISFTIDVGVKLIENGVGDKKK